MSIQTIYVYLPDEAVDVWCPVKAEDLGGNRFKIIDITPNNEKWQFLTGDIVRCESRKFEDGTTGLAAVKKLKQ